MTPSKHIYGFTALMAACATAVLAHAVLSMQPLEGWRFAVLFALTLATSRLKVKLPGITGNMSVNLPFLLLAVSQLSLFEALLVALPACAAQCFPKDGGRPKALQLVFNLSTTTVAVGAASVGGAQTVALAAISFFVAQTLPVAGIISLSEGGKVHKVWAGIVHYSLPFYVLSAGVAYIAVHEGPQIGWQLPLLALPVMYSIYRSYETYFRNTKLSA
jgi:hypothetical protein